MIRPCCGYIDMLATRAMARRSVQDLRGNLNNFHSAMESAFLSQRNGKTFAFSDGAFFRYDDLGHFIQFYKLTRNELFQQKLFFRCSVIDGDLGVTIRAHAGERSDAAEPSFTSMTFTESAAEAYKRESEFKGVGATIKHESSRLFQTDLVESFFIYEENRVLKTASVLDVRFGESELSKPIDLSLDDIDPVPPGSWRVFDQIIDACRSSMAESERLAVYYATAIVTAVRSLDLSRIDYDDVTGAWIDAPYVFQEIASGPVPKVLRHMPGIHLVLLACFDHLYSQRAGGLPDAVADKIMTRLISFPLCFRRLGGVADHVISQDARSYLIRLHGAFEQRNEQLRRASEVARELKVAERRAKELRAAEVAKELKATAKRAKELREAKTAGQDKD